MSPSSKPPLLGVLDPVMDVSGAVVLLAMM